MFPTLALLILHGLRGIAENITSVWVDQDKPVPFTFRWTLGGVSSAPASYFLP